MHGEDLSTVTTPGAKERIEDLRDAQESVTLLAEFQNTTKFVRTAPYAVNDGVAYQQQENFHYNGRADTFFYIGKAFAYRVGLSIIVCTVLMWSLVIKGSRQFLDLFWIFFFPQVSEYAHRPSRERYRRDIHNIQRHQRSKG